MKVKNKSAKQFLFIISVGLSSAATIGLLFYKLNLFFFPNRWMSMLKKVLPNHDKLLYGTGNVQNVHIDSTVTVNDLDTEDFKKENGKLRLNIEKILEKNHIPQNLGHIQKINFDHIIQKNDLDENIFQVKNGKITIDIENLITKNKLLKDTHTTRTVDSSRILTEDSMYLKECFIDLETGHIMHLSKLCSSPQNNDNTESGLLIKENTLIFGNNYLNYFENIYQKKKKSIQTFHPLKIKLLPLKEVNIEKLYQDFSKLIEKFSENIIIQLPEKLLEFKSKIVEENKMLEVKI